jgi:hypothetical protein
MIVAASHHFPTAATRGGRQARYWPHNLDIVRFAFGFAVYAPFLAVNRKKPV